MIPLRLPLLLVTAALLLTGCGPRETRVAAGNRTQTIHIGNMAEPTDLDPQIINSLEDYKIVMNLMEGLTACRPKDCQPVPGVAERWEASPDGLTWTFHLRANAVWSNGDPVTADDFVYAYRRMLSPGLAAEYAYMLFSLQGAREFNTGKLADFTQVGVKAPDARTLVLSLAFPVPYLPSLVYHNAWYPVHRATIEKFGKIDQRSTLWTRPGNYVGNGAFVLSAWEPNQIIRLTKSPTYWDREAVRLQEADFYPIESSTTEEAAFRSGQLHATAQIPSEKIETYQKEHPDFLHQDTNLATYFYRFNVTKPPLNDVRVRRALSLAIDRQAIVERVVKGGQLPAFHLTPPNTAGYTANVTFHEDVAAARQLLAEAGFKDGQGFPRLEILYNTTEGHRLVAESLQQMWRKNLGIDIGLYNQEAKVWNDTMRQGNYQIARYGWVGDYLDPSTFLELMTTGNGNNQTGWSNPEYDRLIDQARRTLDPARRFALYHQAEDLLMAEMPIMPIYFYVRNDLLLPCVKGWYGNLLDLHPLKGVYLEP
ncbi:MAG: peptide ABC transporter substrate-binding protein [Verrucomicrobia bacterium]|nr:peptide ABC transporter substrate-binding protein [Verrucomicrobiota bacterium]